MKKSLKQFEGVGRDIDCVQKLYCQILENDNEKNIKM
jgi:hypothetical protein